MTPEKITWLIVINTVAWLAIHLGFAWAGTRLSPSRFNPAAWWYRPRPFERNKRFYERWFGVRYWKDGLPDGAGWFKQGFRKRRLRATDNTYIERFIVETCRAEFVHWAVFAAGFLFFLWNTTGIALIMLLYAAVANAPCIVLQRYNRRRMQELLNRRQEQGRHHAD